MRPHGIMEGVALAMVLEGVDLDLMALEEVDMAEEEYHWDRWQQEPVPE